MSLGELIEYSEKKQFEQIPSIERHSLSAFEFLRTNRTAARRAQEISMHMDSLLTDRGADFYSAVGREAVSERNRFRYFATRPTRVPGSPGEHVALRKRTVGWGWGLEESQLVVPAIPTSSGAASSDEVFVTARPFDSSKGWLMTPMGQTGLTVEFVDAVDALYSDHLIKNTLPAVGERL